jgi:pimeloyl-ACP methyl ester carboxylesterase
VHGEADPLQSVRAGRATAAAIPGAELITFPDVGHGLPPAQLWPRLFQALDDLRARARS